MARATRLAALLLAAHLFAPITLTAQSSPTARTATRPDQNGNVVAKKVLTIDDFAKWRDVRSIALSDDGRWAAYAYQQRKTDDTLFVRELDAARQYAVPRASRPEFSDDGRWVAYLVQPTVKEVEKLEKDKKPVPLKAELRDLRSGDVVGSWDNVASIRFSTGSKLLAVKKTKLDAKAKHDGTDLILRHLAAGTEELVGSVNEYAFNKSGSHLAFSISTPEREGNGLYLLDVTTAARRPLDGERADYTRLTWDEGGSALAALRGKDADTLEQRANILVTINGIGGRAEPARRVFDPGTQADFPANTVLSEKAALTWSSDGKRVFVGLKEQSKQVKKDENADPEPDVDIWHWQDERIQSVQMIRAPQERNRTHVAAADLAAGKIVRLADETMAAVQLSRDGRAAIGRDERAYVHDWKPQLADVYRVDPATGARTRILTAHETTLGLSPDGSHFLYWKDGHIWDYVVLEDRHVNLTQRAPVNFTNEEYDRFGNKPPYGVAGWTRDGKAVLLDHRYDIYLQPLDGSAARNLTVRGARDSIRFRYVQLDAEERWIDMAAPLLLSAFNDKDKSSGYFRLEKGQLTQLAYGDVSYGRPVKAKKADRLLFTVERFDTYPDYHYSDSRFTKMVRLTEANPQQSEYRWGRRILFDFENSEGVKLQGTLAIPDDYQPGQKLPMLVNFYEKNSQNLHRYPQPRYASAPQFSGFVSNGYLVMQPDIHYRTGASHSQMLDAVEAAVKKVIALGYADPQRIGLHGHSYSGQGSAFIATQSKLFAAIVAGAAATNLVSDFNQLWKSSGTSQHRYDIYGQGRFATNPFDDLALYQSQSAVYNARTMDTPLLLLHGTADGSVEWLQAVEFYNALRFNGKQVVLLSYPGEQHGLTRFENQKDFLERMQGFFDHHLKGVAAPEWYVKGVPFLNKGKARPVLTPVSTTQTGGSGGS